MGPPGEKEMSETKLHGVPIGEGKTGSPGRLVCHLPIRVLIGLNLLHTVHHVLADQSLESVHMFVKVKPSNPLVSGGKPQGWISPLIGHDSSSQGLKTPSPAMSSQAIGWIRIHFLFLFSQFVLSLMIFILPLDDTFCWCLSIVYPPSPSGAVIKDE